MVNSKLYQIINTACKLLGVCFIYFIFSAQFREGGRGKGGPSLKKQLK